MSVKKRTLTYGLAAVLLAIFLIAGASIIGPFANQNGLKSSSTATTNQVTSSGTSSLGVGNTKSPFLVLLTDPPIVPAGTTSLNLTYSGVGVHVESQDPASSWIYTNSSGTVDLLTLVNVSETIAMTSIPNGSAVDRVQFDIASVQIVVNGTLYNVTSVNNKLTVPVELNGAAGTYAGALVDLSPKVIEIITGNSTAFILVPSATAIIRDSSQISSEQDHIGHESDLTSSDRKEINSARGNVSIVSSSLSVNGNITNISIQITNNGNSSVALSGITLGGRFNGSISSSVSCQATSSSTSISHTDTLESESHSTSQVSDSTTTTTSVTTSATTSSETQDGNSNNVIVNMDNTSSVTFTYSDNRSDPSSYWNGSSSTTHTGDQSWSGNEGDSSSGSVCSATSQILDLHEIVFATTANSTNLTPVIHSYDEGHDTTPLILMPNQTITLIYQGTINATFGSGEDGLHSLTSVVVYPVSGNSYGMSLIMSGDAELTAQVVSA